MNDIQDAASAACVPTSGELAAGDFTPSGLPFVGELRWGEHFSQFYDTVEDLRDCLVPFFRAGLENNEKCLWIATEPFGVAEATAALRDSVSNLDALLAAGQIEIIDHGDWYERHGDVAVDDLPGSWLAKADAALAAGYTGLRVTGNAAFLEASGWHDFMHYEAAVHRCFKAQRIVALCSYPIRRCGFEQVLDVIQTHGFAIARRNGRWETIESAALAETKAELARLNRELEARVQARTAELRAAAARLRSVLESTSDSVFVVDRDWRFTYLNPRARARIANGRDLVGADMWAAFPEAVGSTFEREYRKAMTERTPVAFEGFHPVLNAWFEVNARPSEDGLAVFFRDVTERREAEERQRWLTAELNHRVKNVLAAVHSVAARTLPNDGATEIFLGRITALARAHDLQDPEGTALRALVDAELAPYRSRTAEQIRLGGEDIALTSAAAEALGMVLHELATNAAKYGALSTPEGRLDVAWRVEGAAEGRRLTVTWTEQGGPAVEPPSRTGFGSRLIEFSLAHQLDGTAEIDFRREGVRCVIELPFTSEIGKRRASVEGPVAADAGARP